MKTIRTKWAVGLATAGAILAVGATAQAADGTWTNVAGGPWGTAGNWQGSVLPDNGHANLTLTSGSYAVAYDAAGPAISNLFVGNRAGNRTTLTLSAPLAHTGGYINLSNATVYVTNNAVWTYPGINSTADRLMDIGYGSEVVVCGGLVQFTNLLRATTSQKSYINLGVGSTGTLRVVSGQFNLAATNNDPNSSHVLYVGYSAGGAGTLEIADGATVTLGQGGTSQFWPLYVGGNGAYGKVTVAGELAFPYLAPYIGFGANNGSYGELVITNAGKVSEGVNGGGRWTFGSVGNSLGVVRFCGTTNMTPGTYGWEQLNVGYNSGSIAGCSTGLAEISSGSIWLSGNLNVGTAEASTNYAAVGTMNILGGTVFAHTLSGVWVGWGRNGGSAEGTLNVSGGVLRVSNSQAFYYPAGPPSYAGFPVCGLTIGMISMGNLTDDTNQYTRARGTLNLSGGIVSNLYQLAIGVNGATGTVNQTGGIMRHLPADTNRITMIGYGFGTNSYSGAGKGTYNMSGGTFTTPQRVFVGGVPTNVHWFAKSGATGLLRIAGGSFIVSNTVYVGENGSGTVTLGSNGVLTVGNLIATTATSRLRFELGASGLGTFTVTNELRVSSATRLEVDLTGFPPAPSTKLLNCRTRSGSIDPANITITGGLGTVDQSLDEDLYLRQTLGTAIFIR